MQIVCPEVQMLQIKNLISICISSNICVLYKYMCKQRYLKFLKVFECSPTIWHLFSKMKTPKSFFISVFGYSGLYSFDVERCQILVRCTSEVPNHPLIFERSCILIKHTKWISSNLFTSKLCLIRCLFSAMVSFHAFVYQFSIINNLITQHFIHWMCREHVINNFSSKIEFSMPFRDKYI